MATTKECPSTVDLEQFLLGRLPEGECARLGDHVLHCSRCLQVLKTVDAKDTLVGALRRGGGMPAGTEPAAVEGLIARLRQLGPGAASSLPPGTPQSAVASGMIAFPCPHCGKRLRVKPEWAGKQSKCPACRQPLKVPAQNVMASESQTVPPANFHGAGRDTKSEAHSLASTGSASSQAGAPKVGGRQPYDFLAAAEQPGEIGRLGVYRILKVLGAGGMGVVFQAEDSALKRKIALKAMLPSLAADESAKLRFLREAQAAAAVEHDHIVPIYQVGEDRGVPFIAMPFLKGESLDDRLKREPALPIAEVLRIGREAAQGLAAAHAQGLVHRDIKPANLWLEGTGGRVKILDFGLAKAATDAAHLTQSGAILGTPAYMAPEQGGGQVPNPRSDLFSLGCVLYQACTGERPFQGPDVIATLAALALHHPPPPREVRPEVPQALSDLVLHLLAKKPVDRPESAQVVAAALIAIAEDKTATLTGARRAKRPPRPGGLKKVHSASRNRRWLGLIVAAAVVLLGGLVAAGVMFSLKTRHGTLVVTVSEPDVQVLIDGEAKVIVDSKKVGRLELIPGEHKLTVKRGEEELYTESFTLKSGGEQIINAKWTPKTQQAIPQQPAKEDPWLKQVAAMSTAKQVEAVAAKLKELNPGFDGTVTPTVTGGVVTGLRVMTDSITDLSPVRALPSLQTLDCSGNGSWVGFFWVGKGQVADLSPLKNLKLTSLNCASTKVSDLSPLKDLKLTSLNCNGAPVSDLSPLKDLKLTNLDVSSTRVSDLSPLKNMRLTSLDCARTKVSDLSPLKDMKLRNLGCAGTNVSDLSPLKDMKLANLDCNFTPVSDLSPLKDMKLTFLTFGFTNVSDLSPLRGILLDGLQFDHSKVTDLSPLKDLQLTFLNIAATPVSDLSPLKDMRLIRLHCQETKVTDLSPLRGMPLKELSCNFSPERHAAILRSIQTLERINGKPAAEFWKQVDARPASAPPPRANQAGAPAFVPLFNGKDLTGWKVYPSGTGTWKVEDGLLVGSGPVSHLFSERGDYTNFHFRVEAMINDGGNSGQYFRAQFGPRYPNGYEAQINCTHRDPVKTGSLYPAFNPKLANAAKERIIVRKQLHRPNEWFTQDVIATGSHIVIKVNGQTTVDFVDAKNTYVKGHLALQQHDPGTVVKFRKIEVKGLP